MSDPAIASSATATYTPTSVVEVIRVEAQGVLSKLDQLIVILNAIDANTRPKK